MKPMFVAKIPVALHVQYPSRDMGQKCSKRLSFNKNFSNPAPLGWLTRVRDAKGRAWHHVPGLFVALFQEIPVLVERILPGRGKLVADVRTQFSKMRKE